MFKQKELILCCECGCLDHIARFVYYPPEEGKELEEEDNVIYVNFPAKNLYRSFSPFYFWGFDFDYFFRFNFLKRFPYALRNIFRPKTNFTKWKDSVLNCFDFQEKDLDTLYDYLSILSKDEEEVLSAGLRKDSDFGDFDICFYVDRIDEDFPFTLNFTIVFQRQKLWKRIYTSLKYVFGTHSDEIPIQLGRHNVEVLKAYITLAKKKNKEWKKQKEKNK